MVPPADPTRSAPLTTPPAAAQRPIRRVAAVGFQGFGNLGDEAILAGIEAVLEGSGIEITTVYGGPQRGSSESRAARRSPPRLFPGVGTVRELRRLDGLLLSGGGLFNDHWPGVIPRYLAWVLAARLAGVPVVWVGVGVGPIRRRGWRLLARLAARLSRLVLVRDEESAVLLGSPSARVRVIPDPAAFLPAPAPPERTQDRVAIVVRPSIRGSHDARIVDAVGGLVDILTAQGRKVELLSFAPAVDARIIRALAEGRTLPRPELGDDPRAALARLAEYGAVVSLRLHGLLLASIAGVPCLPVAYDAKVTHLAERLDLGDVVLPVEQITAADLALGLKHVLEPSRRVRVASALDALRARRDEVRRSIEAAL